MRHALGCAALMFLLAAAPAGADVNFTTTATNVPTDQTFPSEIVSADFNNDGIGDIATPNCGDLCGSPGPAGSVSVLLGNGTGGFNAARERRCHPRPVSRTPTS